MSVPTSELGPPPPTCHSTASKCVPPPTTKGGGHSPAEEGVGGSQFIRLEKKPSTLSTQWSVPSVRIGTPHHLSLKRVCSPTQNQRGVTHSPMGGGGGSQFRRLEEKPGTLSTLCLTISNILIKSLTSIGEDWWSRAPSPSASCPPSWSQQRTSGKQES